MSKTNFGALLACVGLLVGATAANASSITIAPADGKDAQIVQGGGLDDYQQGSVSDLITNYSGNLRSIGLIEFDLSAIAAGSSVSSATLSLFHLYNNCQGCRYDIFRVTSAWDENTVTFATAPTHDATAAASLVIGDQLAGRYRSWDITSLVAGWVSGAYANYGMWIEEVPFDGSATAYFESSDTWEVGADPALGVTYTARAVPEPSTLALWGIALAGVGLAARRRRLLG